MALFFWSKIGSGFGGPGGTPQPTIPWITHPPPPTSLGALTYSWNKVTAWSLTSLSATSSCTITHVACVAGVFWLFYFVVRKVRGTASHKLDQGRKRKWWFFSLRSSLARLFPDSFRFCPRLSFRAAESFTLRTAIQTKKKPTKTQGSTWCKTAQNVPGHRPYCQCCSSTCGTCSSCVVPLVPVVPVVAVVAVVAVVVPILAVVRVVPVVAVLAVVAL